jgi:Ca2+-binding RTX toxin-like protein
MAVSRVVQEFRILDEFLPSTVSAYDLKTVALANGQFVAVWRTFDAKDPNNYILKIQYRIMNADGTPAGATISVPASTPTEKLVTFDIDVLPDGRFLLTWQTIDNTGSLRHIWAQSFNADGSASTLKVSLGNFTAGAEISVQADGSFLVAREVPWSETGQAAEVHVQKYNAAGVKLGPDIALTTSEQGLAYKPQIDTLTNGKVVVVWYQSSSVTGLGFDNSLGGIRARILNADGSLTSIDFAVNTTINKDQDEPKVTALATGGFVVTWESEDAGDGSGGCIRARVFNAAGVALGNDFIVNTLSEGHQRTPDIIALNDGRFVVVWDSEHASGTGGDIRARLFNADGSPASDEFIVNSLTSVAESNPTVEVLANGNLLFSWQVYVSVSGQSYVASTVFDPGISPINGTAGNDSVLGTAAYDVINGFAGDDSLYGRAGNDTLNGGDGHDSLTGGVGADKLNGGAGFDHVRYEGATSGITVALYNSAANTGEAFGDTYTDIEGLVGGQFHDILYGDGAGNSLYGVGGNDWIDGMGGLDYLIGGDGDDVLVSHAGAQVLDGGNGFDIARYEWATVGVIAALYNSTLNTGEAAGDTYTSIEGLVGSVHTDYLYGNSAVNYIHGYDGGDWIDGMGGLDTLVGGGGHDNLVSRAGAQTFYGGDGFDFVRYETSNGAVAAALYDATKNTGEAKGDVYSEIEGLVGSNYNDYLYGNSVDNYIYGMAGNDWIDGLGGRDVLVGNDGDDNLVSRSGAELFDGGAGFDFVRYEYAYAGVSAALYNASVNTGEAAGDTYIGIEGLVGSYFGDYLYGSTVGNFIYGLGGNDWIDGLGGTDTLFGDAGDDNLVSRAGAEAFNGGADFDYVRYEYAATGVKADLSNAAVNTGEARKDTYLSIEGLVGSNHTDGLYGNGLANTLFGIGGNDRLFGNGGNDTLEGGVGNDILDGGTGNDNLIGGANRDVMTGGAGSDTFVFSSLADFGAVGGYRDYIMDFQHLTDRMHLSGIDAKSATAGDDAFTYIGSAQFTAEGQIRAVQSGLNTLVMINTAGASGTDMTIVLSNHNLATRGLSAADFEL